MECSDILLELCNAHAWNWVGVLQSSFQRADSEFCIFWRRKKDKWIVQSLYHNEVMEI